MGYGRIELGMPKPDMNWTQQVIPLSTGLNGPAGPQPMIEGTIVLPTYSTGRIMDMGHKPTSCLDDIFSLVEWKENREEKKEMREN